MMNRKFLLRLLVAAVVVLLVSPVFFQARQAPTITTITHTATMVTTMVTTETQILEKTVTRTQPTTLVTTETSTRTVTVTKTTTTTTTEIALSVRIINILKSFGYKECGRVSLTPGVNTIFIMNGTIDEELMCYFILERPSDEHYVVSPYVFVNFFDRDGEPITAKFLHGLVHLSDHEGRVRAVSHPGWEENWDPSNPTQPVAIYIAPLEMRYAKADFVYFILLRNLVPHELPIRGVAALKALVVKELPESIPLFLSPIPLGDHPAARLGIYDIKEYMEYMGYENCGEFTAEDTAGVQNITFTTDINLSQGRACYIMVHPPSGNKTLNPMEYRIDPIYINTRANTIDGTRPTFGYDFEFMRYNFELSGYNEVPPPYKEKLHPLEVGGGGASFGSTVAGSLVILFAAKSDYGGVIRLRITAEFTVVPAERIR